ncbi:MAG: dipeptide ABC transporter permease DppC, partial [Proteobacteria bacterium]|nr:dipeptide ABC transporter permease DppC [Pseudomonadota bacterium]
MSAPPSSFTRTPPHPLRELWGYFSQNRGALLGLAIVCLMVLLAIFADVVAPYPATEQYRDATLLPPAWQEGGSHRFILGTDPVGRDILSRLIHGTRLSLLIGLVSVSLSLGIGTALGLLAGFFLGLTEIAIMRLMDVMLALPSLLLAVAVVAILGPGLINVMYAIGIVLLPHYARLTRAAVIGEMNK